MATDTKKAPFWAIAVSFAVVMGFSTGIIHLPKSPPQVRTPEGSTYFVKQHLRDPDSAEFRNTKYGPDVGAGKALCGEVNAKNGFGGYAGFRRFVSRPDGSVTIDDGDARHAFNDLWFQVC
ncbi:hypothetical protein GO300_01294 [Ralstonia solanacearum]|nr:hypothetical protein [Ralstonia solanacearum]